MTKTITFTQNQDIRIPWKLFQQAHFPLSKKFNIVIRKRVIYITPAEDNGEEEDWMQAPEVIIELERRAAEAEKEIKKGKVRPIEALFKKLGV